MGSWEETQLWLKEVVDSKDVARRIIFAKKLVEALKGNDGLTQQVRKAGAAAKLLRALQSTDDEELLDLIAACIASISGFLSSGAETREIRFGDLTLQVCQSGLEDALGAQLWRSSFILSRLLMERAELVVGLDVLELGSGCGMCGLLAAKLGARKVFLTDCVDAVLQNLRSSVAANFRSDPAVENSEQEEQTVENSCIDCTASVSGGCNSADVRVQFLDWNQTPSAESETTEASNMNLVEDSLGGLTGGLKFDCIIASDVIYEESHAHSLPNCIACYLAPHGRCVLTVPIRQQDIFSIFIENVKSLGLNISVAEVDECNPCDGGISGNVAYEGGFVNVEIVWN